MKATLSMRIAGFDCSARFGSLCPMARYARYFVVVRRR